MPRRPKMPNPLKYTSPLDLYVDKMLQFNDYRGYVGGLSLDLVRDFQRPKDDFGELSVGRIDGNTICKKLWEMMSLNPVRYGTRSPFMFDGHNNIYKFTSGEYAPSENGRTAMGTVEHYLFRFMESHGIAKNQTKKWDADVMPSDGGLIYPSVAMGNALVNLIYAFMAVADQNQVDFQNPKYHDAILAAVNERMKPAPTPAPAPTPTPAPVVTSTVSNVVHPATPRPVPGVQLEINFDIPVADLRARQTIPYPKFDKKTVLNYDTELPSDKELDAEDSANITLSNRGNVSPEVYAQALAEKHYFDTRD